MLRRRDLRKIFCNNKIIASHIVYCDSFLRKGTGLMFHPKNALRDTAWIFRFGTPKKIGITMMFVFFPIDVIFLDSKDKIVGLKENLRPFSNHSSKVEISSFVELECGTIKKHRIKKGQTIFFRR